MDNEVPEDALEVCRPGSADFDAPEWAELRDRIAHDPQLRAQWQQVQRQDVAVARAFRVVPIPEGLEQRLLERLQAEAVTSATLSRLPDKVEVPQRRSRRWWLAGVATAAAAAVLAVSLNRQAPPPTADELSRLAQQWSGTIWSQAERDSRDWKAFSSQQFPRLAWRPTRWRMLDTSLDPKAVVFEFQPRTGRLLLFRLSLTDDLALPSLPYRSLSASGSLRVGAWREGDFVYVAVTDQPQLLDGFRSGLAPT